MLNSSTEWLGDVRWFIKRIELWPIILMEAMLENKVPDSVSSELFPSKMKRSVLSKEVYAQLKKMILSGKFKEGQRVSEKKLARRLRMRRNPVQIALLRLRKEYSIIWK